MVLLLSLHLAREATFRQQKLLLSFVRCFTLRRKVVMESLAAVILLRSCVDSGVHHLFT